MTYKQLRILYEPSIFTKRINTPYFRSSAGLLSFPYKASTGSLSAQIERERVDDSAEEGQGIVRSK